MSKLINEDINDDEIRIISADDISDGCKCSCMSPEADIDEATLLRSTKGDFVPSESSSKKHRKGFWLGTSLFIVVTVVILGVFLFSNSESESEPFEKAEVFREVVEEAEPAVASAPRGSVMVKDTVFDGKKMRIYEPQNAMASLLLGNDVLVDSTIILATQAADIRSDNGEILGTFVLNGELKSKGESKAGFCAIINGQPTIGVADATPMLEQTLTEGGYFFRQYPLVVGGQAVENKPKGRAIRKALAEIDNRTVVIVSHDKLTFGEFSEVLTAGGVRNAIYLCGGDSYGFYIDDNGKHQRIDDENEQIGENISFIIWR